MPNNLTIFLIFLFGLFVSFSGCVKPYSQNYQPIKKSTYYYGNDKRNFIDVYYQGSNKTAIVVHGGGFIGGSARSKNTKIIINYFSLKSFM